MLFFTELLMPGQMVDLGVRCITSSCGYICAEDVAHGSHIWLSGTTFCIVQQRDPVPIQKFTVCQPSFSFIFIVDSILPCRQ